MATAGEGQQQVHRQRPVAEPAGGGDLAAQVAGRQDADRSQAARVRYGRGELVPRQAAAHSGLNDRELHSQTLKERAHGAHRKRMVCPPDHG